MKYIFSILVITSLIASCGKDKDNTANITVDGYWQIQDPTYTLNTTRDLYHLFKPSNAYYKLSFLKADNFSNLNLRPQTDSLISFYQVNGRQLMLPNLSASATNVVPGNDLLSQTANEMTFTRFIIVKRDASTGVILQTRTDTIRYTRVSDPIKVTYFDNYLKRWHP